MDKLGFGREEISSIPGVKSRVFLPDNGELGEMLSNSMGIKAPDNSWDSSAFSRWPWG